MTTQVNGDTGVSQVQPSVVTQADLAAGVAGTGPAFEAYASADQTVTSGVSTKMVLNTKSFDLTNAYNTSTHRFNPQVAGYYQVNVRSRGVASTTLNSSWVEILKNGAVLTRAAEMVGPTTYTFGGSALVYLNGTTDYLEFACVVNGTGTIYQAVTGSSIGAYGPRVSAFLARAV